jgi:glycosyltransferase involved in cell wall biosynthesis
MTKKKILIIGRVFSSEKGVSGPSSIIMALVKEFQALKVNFELLGYDSDKMSKMKYFMLLFRKVLFSKGMIVNVHTEGFLIPFIVYIISLLNPTHEYYLTIHGIYIIQAKYMGGIIKAGTKRQEEILIRHFPNLICVSEMLRNDIERLFNRTSRVFVANNGIYIEQTDFQEEKKLENSIRLISTGGVKKIKGVFESLELLEYLNSKSEEMKTYLYIYGGADDEETLNAFKETVKKKEIEDFVQYKGVIKNKKELYEKYSEAHLSLALSHYDTFNAAIVESMVCGTPVIASDNCGASYLLRNGEDGFVVKLENSYKENIYQILHHCICETKDFNLIRKNAYNTSRKYSWNKAAKGYLDVLYNNK